MLLLSLFAALSICQAADLTGQSITQRLGYSAEDRLLIINADDFGMSHATNLAVFDAFEKGVLTSATLMMPTAWVKEAANWIVEHPEANVGIHLTHTAEWGRYKWAPIASRAAVPGLCGPDGYMWPACVDVWKNATPQEAVIESRAQIDLARKMGIEPTHFDSHMGTMQLNPEFWQAYLQLAIEYALPQRQASESLYAMVGQPGLKQVERQSGVAGPDYLMVSIQRPDTPAQMAEVYNNILRNLEPGLTELYLHPALDGPEMQAISGSHEWREADYRWLIAPETRALINELGIKLISYRDLKVLMQPENNTN